MKPRKPLNQREAAQIAIEHIGVRGGVRIQRTVVGPEWSSPFIQESRQIIELKLAGGGLVIHGEHPTSWRKAFEAAGIFETRD